MPSRPQDQDLEAPVTDIPHAPYWDKRYALIQEKATESAQRASAHIATFPDYDWTCSFRDIKPILTTHLSPPPPPTQANQSSATAGQEQGSIDGARILHLGCGNSTVPADLAALGYRNQVCVDFSRVVIHAMHEKHSHDPQTQSIDWRVSDVRDLQPRAIFPTGGFDVCIDKGTLDTMIPTSAWNPPDEVRENVKRYVAEVARVTRKGGVWICVSSTQPPDRLRLLLFGREGEGETKWDVSCEKVTGEIEYNAWVCRRK